MCLSVCLLSHISPMECLFVLKALSCTVIVRKICSMHQGFCTLVLFIPHGTGFSVKHFQVWHPCSGTCSPQCRGMNHEVNRTMSIVSSNPPMLQPETNIKQHMTWLILCVCTISNVWNIYSHRNTCMRVQKARVVLITLVQYKYTN